MACVNASSYLCSSARLRTISPSAAAPVEFKSNIENTVDARKYRSTVVLLLKLIIEESSLAPFRISLLCASFVMDRITVFET